jgi:hypothetical protein
MKMSISCVLHILLSYFGSKAEFRKADQLQKSEKVIPLQAWTDPVGVQEVETSYWALRTCQFYLQEKPGC